MDLLILFIRPVCVLGALKLLGFDVFIKFRYFVAYVLLCIAMALGDMS